MSVRSALVVKAPNGTSYVVSNNVHCRECNSPLKESRALLLGVGATCEASIMSRPQVRAGNGQWRQDYSKSGLLRRREVYGFVA